MSELEKQKRDHELDLVRAVAMMLGLVIHVSIFFMDDQDSLFFEQASPLDEVRDPYGRTALHLAASVPEGYRDYNPIEKLLPHFKHPDLLDMMRRTPLFNASRKGNMEDVRLLLAAGDDPNLPDRYGHTAVHPSAIKLHLRDPNAASVHRRILNLLQEHGADMTLKDVRGRTVRDLETRL